jgi:MFS superfamily sulfate permease-like transporter
VAIFRPEASLVYFNVEHVRDTILRWVRGQSPPPRLVVLDLSASPYVDLQSVEALMGMAGELAAAGIRVQVVEGHATVRERLRAAGADAKLGRVDRFRSVADVLGDGTG